MESIQIKKELTPQRKILSPLRPEKLRRQHTYVYIALLFLTALFIYYYSYPLGNSKENFTRVIEPSDYYEPLVDNEQFTVNTRTDNFESPSSTTNTSQKQQLIKVYYKNYKYSFLRKNDATMKMEDSTPKEISDNLTQQKEQRILIEEQDTFGQQNTISKQNDNVKIIEESEVISVQPNSVTTAFQIRTVPTSRQPRTAIPTLKPSFALTSRRPSSAPTSRRPSSAPTSQRPSFAPTSRRPSSAPTSRRPSSAPTSRRPSIAPTSRRPSSAPTSRRPSSAPTSQRPSIAPTSRRPSIAPRSRQPSFAIPTSQLSSAFSNLQPSAKSATMKTRYTSDENISIHGQNNEDIITENEEDLFQQSTVTAFNNKIVLETTQTSSTADKFLVYSKNCKIPDIDPMHPSILGFVEFTDPLVCKDEDPLTITDGNTLLIDKAAAKNRSLKEDEFFCCYRPLYRDKEGFSDNKVAFGHCHDFEEKANIRDEFVKVECAYKNDTTFYTEYHSFIHDKTHVEERCNKYNGTRYSVLIVGIDSVSRMNMHRQLNKTSSYLLENMEAFEMYGFNKVGDNTFPNLIPLLTGYDERELPQVCFNQTDDESLDKCNFLWKSYANNGYRTLYAEDSPYISTFNYVKRGFFQQPTDYYIRHFMLAYEKALGHKKSLNCYTCLGSVSATEAVLHWAEQFASHFHDRPYFAFNWINSLTHDYMNLASSGDHFYEQFFRRLHQSGALNKTIVIVMGDHGMRWGPIRETYIGRLEERLPMLLIALPQDFKREFPNETEALRGNSHRLVTPFDLHATLANLLHLKENWTFTNPDKVNSELASNFTRRAQSLFQPVAENRSCDEASIEEHWCTCESSLPMDTDDDHVMTAAQFLIKKLNKLLKPVRKMCAKLNLDTISDARVWSPSFEHQGHTKDDNILTVIVRTSPGMAMFEGTVRISAPDDNCELLGTVSRLNLYGNQSACVREAVLRKYCYCL